MEERYKVTVTNDLQSVDIVDLQENKNVFSESFILLSTAHFICDLFNKIDKQEIKIKELEKENQQLKQSQNKRAIEVLEKLKNNIWDLNIGDYYLQNGGLFENIKVKRAEVYELIDNQIKELRSEE